MNDDEVPISEERKVPRILMWIYVLLIIGGILAFFNYWNGSHGWLDRGFWKPLQQAAETTLTGTNHQLKGGAKRRTPKELAKRLAHLQK